MRVNDTLPEVGAEFEWDIAEIMERTSADVHSVDEWEGVLEEKRLDGDYKRIKNSIKRYGFVRPLTAYVSEGKLKFCDGHHRLAAAIDLGLTTVPVSVSRQWRIAEDSGDWDGRIRSARTVGYDTY